MGDQGVPPHGTPEGREVGEDHEEEGQHGEVQGAVQSLPLHPQGRRQGEGREAETVSSTGPPREGYQQIQEVIMIMMIMMMMMMIMIMIMIMNCGDGWINMDRIDYYIYSIFIGIVLNDFSTSQK